MKRALVILFVLICSVSFATNPTPSVSVGTLIKGLTASGAAIPILVDETGKLYGLGGGGGGAVNIASDSQGRILTVPSNLTGSFPVNIVGGFQFATPSAPISYATDTSNRLSVHIAANDLSSFPSRITNWNEMPTSAGAVYATDSMNRLKMVLDAATSTPLNVVVNGGTMTMDIPTDPVTGSLLTTITGYASTTPIPVSATLAGPKNATDGSPIVSISTYSLYVASISTGLILDTTVTVGTVTPKLLSDITSGTQPVPLVITNLGSVPLYYSMRTPDPLNSPYIAPGGYITINAGNNVLNYKFLSDPVAVASMHVGGHL